MHLKNFTQKTEKYPVKESFHILKLPGLVSPFLSESYFSHKRATVWQ